MKAELAGIVERLASDRPHDTKYQDHPLKGNKIGYRECHIRPDLLLLYRLQDGEVDLVVLTRLGNHSEILDL
ncbi:MAG: type II toxin-antitoxin system YafQ family toxin [Pyramidobacter sp.]